MRKAEAQLTRQAVKSWPNWHASYRHVVKEHFVLENPDLHGAPPSLSAMRATVATIQQLIGNAVDAGIRIRALGNDWSLSEIAATDGWMLATGMLRWSVSLRDDQVSDLFKNKSESLRFVQAGYSISALNKKLEKDLGRSLKTSGASNGQTIVGAMSTGTHGSAIDCGAIQSQVRTIHLITSSSRNVLLERDAEPVVNEAFAQELGAELIRDTALFDAALVGLGSMGIVHAVVIESDPLFLLEAYQRWVPLDDGLKQAMKFLDFNSLGLRERPYFFQVVVNPYATDGRVCLKYMIKKPWPAGRELDYRIEGKIGAGYDVAGVLAALLDSAPFLTPAIVNALVRDQLKVFSGEEGSWGEIFNYSFARPAAVGCALAIRAEDSLTALRLAKSELDAQGFAPVIFACRYVQKTSGWLSFTRFDPTCVLDIDGVGSRRAIELMELVRARFEKEGLEYAQHWGKMHGLAPARVRASYGADLDQWLAARRRLLTPPLRASFTNALLDSLDMSD